MLNIYKIKSLQIGIYLLVSTYQNCEKKIINKMRKNRIP